MEDELKWVKTSSYAAVSNNGYLDVDFAKIGSPYLFDPDHVEALKKCSRGALMGYENQAELVRNTNIFESELKRIKGGDSEDEKPIYNKNKKLIEDLELAHGCIIGSHTDNISGQDQLKSIITKLKSELERSRFTAQFCKPN